MSAADEVRELLKKASERDKQRLVGPSSLGSPCSYCLANEMLNGGGEQGRYWMGARIGTAIHNELEQLVLKYRPETFAERRVTIGEIPGYGVIKGTADWTVVPRVVDFKTTTRDKSVFLKRAFDSEPGEYEVSKITDARFKWASYINQTHLYGLGLENEGFEITQIDVVFINRDGKEDSDVWSRSIPYERERAEKVLDRARRLWLYISDGGDIEALNSAHGCYSCGVEGRI